MLQTVISVDPLTESNCYILAEDKKCVVIDPGESEQLPGILGERGWEPELILLTHEHCDHMAGLDALRETYPQARFAASKVCNDGIQNTRLNMSRIMEVYLYFRGKPGCAAALAGPHAASGTSARTYTRQCRYLPG